MQVTRAASRLLAAGLFTVALPGHLFGQTLASAADPYFEFLIARRLESQGDQAGALAALQRAAAADPKSSTVRAEIAAFHLRLNHRDEAEKMAAEALALDQDSPDAHRVMGLILAARAEAPSRGTSPVDIGGNLRAAISHLEKASVSPASASDINLFYTLGRLYLRNGDGEKAVQTLLRVVALNPGSVQGRLTLAQAYVDARDMNAAIQTLEEIAEDEPRVAGVLGQYLEQVGRPADAVKAYSMAIGAAPMNRDLKFRRVTALFRARQFEEAANAAAEAQSQHPDDLRFPRIRARALAESGSAARAIEVLEPSARANPGDAATQFALADLYNNAGRSNDAERTVRQLITLEPSNADALNYLGYLLAERGQQLDEAVRLVRRALDIEPDNPSYLDSLGWAYDAEKYLTPAAQKLSNNAVVQDHMGDLLARRGKWQEAIAAWTRALEGEGTDVDRAAIQRKIVQAKSRTR
jgi:tetratricopeptide (TPR) repeat protein